MFMDLGATSAPLPIYVADQGKIVGRYENFIKVRTRRFLYNQQNGKFSFEELYSAATLGALKAAKRFKPQLGYSFATYARSDIDGELNRYSKQPRHKEYDDETYGLPTGRVSGARFAGLKWRWERDGHLHEKMTVAPALKNLGWKRDPDACLRNGWGNAPPHDRGDRPVFDARARSSTLKVTSRFVTQKEIEGDEEAVRAELLETDIREARRHAAKRGAAVEVGCPRRTDSSLAIQYIMAEPRSVADLITAQQLDKQKSDNTKTWGGRQKKNGQVVTRPGELAVPPHATEPWQY